MGEFSWMSLRQLFIDYSPVFHRNNSFGSFHNAMVMRGKDEGDVLIAIELLHEIQ
jgi:hypothetical protein